MALIRLGRSRGAGRTRTKWSSSILFDWTQWNRRVPSKSR
ncbi:unnamed protein product [Darwinula stevensoni]|uniref:Uncharacterized protein n=1 Tax=Darwinula stevensoni TaxID=69355 RepID=A0A7R9FTU5_9CRUS|nr:unnamed protein product [Darwinula stevensoni]CAG0906106.1 unnamed protein product [Darwinula stevensoni]